MAEITVTIDTEQQKQAINDSFAKLDPRYLVKNPVLFVVELGTIIGLVMTIAPGLFGASDSRVYYVMMIGTERKYDRVKIVFGVPTVVYKEFVVKYRCRIKLAAPV